MGWENARRISAQQLAERSQYLRGRSVTVGTNWTQILSFNGPPDIYTVRAGIRVDPNAPSLQTWSGKLRVRSSVGGAPFLQYVMDLSRGTTITIPGEFIQVDARLPFTGPLQVAAHIVPGSAGLTVNYLTERLDLGPGADPDTNFGIVHLPSFARDYMVATQIGGVDVYVRDPTLFTSIEQFNIAAGALMPDFRPLPGDSAIVRVENNAVGAQWVRVVFRLKA